MIMGIGIDSIEIERFNEWKFFSHKKLSRIFSQQEINYCLQCDSKSAERFAVRFAAREAFFKAFSTAFPTISVPFLTMCSSISITKNKGRPIITFNWEPILARFLLIENSSLFFHVSFTHTKTSATAFVIISQTNT